jgi:L-phenylalanine/L-methionine N-acetyltransferase
VDIIVRHSEPEDYRALHRIFSGPRAIAGTLQMPFPRAEMWRERLSEPPEGLYSLVACVEDEVVGEISLHTSPTRWRMRHVGSIGMSVQDDWQGKGVGTALMEAALYLADNWLNLTRIELSVYVDNAAGMAFRFSEDSAPASAPSSACSLVANTPLTSGVPSSCMTTLSFRVLYSLLRSSGESLSRDFTVTFAYAWSTASLSCFRLSSRSLRSFRDSSSRRARMRVSSSAVSFTPSSS